MECWIVGILDDLPSSGTSNPITPILQYSNTPVLHHFGSGFVGVGK